MPNVFDLYQLQGQTNALSLRWLEDDIAVDLNGWTAAFQMRETFRSASSLISLTSGGGQISLDNAGHIIVSFSPALTSALVVPTRATVKKIADTIWFLLGAYNLELTSPLGRVVRLLEGKFYLDPEIVK